ncbi:TPA: restriction endonuclease subunit S, partial [Klebsiella pneumoniae]
MSWPMVKLGDVCQITMGQAPSGSFYNEKGQGYALIAGAGDFGQKKPIPKKYTTKASKLSKLGDIILCIRATIGDLNWSDKEYCLGRGVAGLRGKESLDQGFLWHCLNYNRNVLSSKGTGSTFKQISRNHIEELIIPLPPIEEQRRIADILDKADGIRQKRKQAIKLAENFLRVTFLEMFNNPVKNPKNLKKAPITELAEIITGFAFKSNDYVGDSLESVRLCRGANTLTGYLDWG